MEAALRVEGRHKKDLESTFAFEDCSAHSFPADPPYMDHSKAAGPSWAQPLRFEDHRIEDRGTGACEQADGRLDSYRIEGRVGHMLIEHAAPLAMDKHAEVSVMGTYEMSTQIIAFGVDHQNEVLGVVGGDEEVHEQGPWGHE